MPRRNHGNSRVIKVSPRVVEAARLAAERHADQIEAYEATGMVTRRRLTRAQWKRLQRWATA